MRKAWAARLPTLADAAAAGEALSVDWWPAQLAPGPSLTVIGIEGDGERTAARLRVRAALRSAIAELSGQPLECVSILSEPGRAPCAEVHGTAAAPGIAISHDGMLSLAAINPDGAVGIDVMRVQEITDWRAVARDYLGPGVADALAALAPGHRPAAFARAWTEHEARLKCHGLQLTEWCAQLQHQIADCRSAALALPDGYVGAVAWLAAASR